MFKFLKELKIKDERIKDLEEVSEIKQHRIHELIDQLYSEKKELIEDFILILEHRKFRCDLCKRTYLSL